MARARQVFARQEVAHSCERRDETFADCSRVAARDLLTVDFRKASGQLADGSVEHRTINAGVDQRLELRDHALDDKTREYDANVGRLAHPLPGAVQPNDEAVEPREAGFVIGYVGVARDPFTRG